MFFVVLFIMAIVVLYSFSMTKSILIEQAEENLALENEKLSNSISKIFEQKGEAVYQLSIIPVIQQFMQANLTQQNIRAFPDYEKLQKLLTTIDNRNDDFFHVSIIHEKNNYFISGHNYISDPTYEVTSRPWYAEASRAEGLAYSSPYVDYESGEQAILITYPLFVDQEKHGYFSATVHMNLIAETLHQLEQDGKRIILISSQGDVLYDLENAWGDFQTTKINAVQNTQFDKDAERYYASSRHLEALGWDVVVYVPEKMILAPLTSFENKIRITWISAVVLLLLSLALILHHFLKDIPIIVDRINEIKNGNFSQKLSIKRHDEVGEIALAIDNMAEQIQHQMTVLDYHASHDSLTGLANRTSLENTLRQWIEDATKEDAILLAFLDLDQFKSINDSKGHAHGDALLIEVGKRVQNSLPENAFLSRFGGDEFVLILKTCESELQQAYELIEHIHASFVHPFHLFKHQIYITTSIGISIFRADAHTPEQLLVNADTALYQAKRSGRNRVYYYNYELKKQMEKELQLKSGLRDALLNEQFFLHYQPQYHLNNPNKMSVEALLRWKHPDLGMISPADFIPLAEKTGLIVEIGDWVIEASLKMYKRMKEQGLPLNRIAINISAIQFQEAEFVQKLQQKLQQYDIPPNALEIEITESIIIKQPDEMIKKLIELSDLGIQIALDDFGTGYSSLNYLRTMPIDVVKVDRSFIVQIEEDQVQKSILKTIIALGHKLDFQVVAEGIEEQSQVAILEEMAVDIIQGYYFSKPLSELDLIQFIQSS